MTDTPASSALLKPETILFPDDHPFLVRTEKSETLYYPYDFEKEQSFIRKVSFLKNGKYNLDVLAFTRNSAQPCYSRTLAKGSETQGIWNNGKLKPQNLKFIVKDNILSEYNGKKIAKQSWLNPVNNAVIQSHNWNNPFFPVIYTENPDRTGLKTEYRNKDKIKYGIHKLPKRTETETFYGVPHGISRSYNDAKATSPYTISYYRFGQVILNHRYDFLQEDGPAKFLPQLSIGNVLIQYDEDDNKAYCYTQLEKQEIGSHFVRTIAALDSGDVMQRDLLRINDKNVYDTEGEYDPSSQLYPSSNIVGPMSIESSENIKIFLDMGRDLAKLKELPMGSDVYTDLRAKFISGVQELKLPGITPPDHQLG